MSLPTPSATSQLHSDKAPGLQLNCKALQPHSQAELSFSSTVISIGSEAFKFLGAVDNGRVIAVFERCFYVQFPSGIVCVAIQSLGEGPLHILLDSEGPGFSGVVSNGMLISLELRSESYESNDGKQASGSLIELPLNLFSGHVPRTRPDLSFKRVITRKHQSAKPMDQHGFGWIAGIDEWQIQSNTLDRASADKHAFNNELRKVCIPAITSLIEWLSAALNAQKDSALIPKDPLVPFSVLLGAGTGLTPAGDDLLAGVLLALHYSDQGDSAEALWKLLEPHLNHRTNAISAAHLTLAARGQCAMPVLQLLDCLFASDAMSDANSQKNVARLYHPADIHTLADNIGATSGWDMLAGMTLVTRAL